MALISNPGHSALGIPEELVVQRETMDGCGWDDLVDGSQATPPHLLILSLAPASLPLICPPTKRPFSPQWHGWPAGKPLGAVRASVGYFNTWEDVDRLYCVIRDRFQR